MDLNKIKRPCASCPGPVPRRRRPRPRTAGPEELAAATVIGDRVRRLATARGGRIGWIAPQPVAYGVWDFAPLGEDLYSGLSGIGLFLARLGRLSGHQRFTSLALDPADDVVRRIHARAAAADDGGWGAGLEADIGSFGDWMGPLYFLAHLDRTLGGTPHLAAVREPVLSAAGRAPGRHQGLRCRGRLGGLRPGPARPGRRRHDDDGWAAAFARRAARHLVTGTVPGGTGWSQAWEHHRIDSTRLLTGFAHGVAGIVTALAYVALARRTGGTARRVPLIPAAGATATGLVTAPGWYPLLFLLVIEASMIRGNVTLLQGAAPPGLPAAPVTIGVVPQEPCRLCVARVMASVSHPLRRPSTNSRVNREVPSVDPCGAIAEADRSASDAVRKYTPVGRNSVLGSGRTSGLARGVRCTGQRRNKYLQAHRR
ncbi:hypothetical protein AB0I77_15090 [Streptomyces sp. NPDC050619]|uniref:hypothetical protein n=1 Tax=Streptomyces sp. NPDC050619 TaxID=3157214 RepID=UPI0034307C8D